MGLKGATGSLRALRQGAGVAPGFKGRSIISIRDFSREDILAVLNRASAMEAQAAPLLSGKLLATLFFEPSTRTRLSFESAMTRLGGRVISVSEGGSSSMAKGETVRDAARMAERYADVLVIRHPLDGAARAAAEAVGVPVINGGDGANQHPTQTLLDLYAIRKCQGRLDSLTVAMVGDLKYGRTVHSLALALRFFSPRFFFVSPPSLRMPQDILEELEDNHLPFTETESLGEAVLASDILYMTRIQKERFPDKDEYEKVKGAYILEAKSLAAAKATLRVMHPLPRVNEIATDVDRTPHAYYFEQAACGIPVRQALLCMVLGAME